MLLHGSTGVLVLPQKSGPTLTMSFDKKEDCNAEEAPQA